MDVLKQLKLGRGRGGRGSRGSGRGRGAGGGRGGRGGRGRGNNTISRAVEVIDLDDGDDICNMALANVELENNSLMQSFEELNNATELNGYDPTSAGGIWIYPINRPVRDYQFDIVNTALFHNTLVSLPTGLGKTFISAVVMYNFARWYPTGIIVFMAPTRPLVAQQLDACHNTVGIEKSRTVELTGHIPAKKREHLWKTKTVFFLTPQVMLSDVERNFFQLENVRCVVVDEAHKALGNHAYVQVISKLIEKNRQFRVLALSATPGSDLAAVQQVFKNLLISRVELRSDSSPDILPYTHDKKKDVRIVKLTGYVKEVYDKIIEIFQEYSGKLMKNNALVGRNAASYSKFQILKARETFRANMGKNLPNYQKGYIEIDFNICISLAHSIEILNSHGLRTFYIFLLGVLDKKKGQPAVTSELRKNEQLQLLIRELQEKLNISIANSTFDFDMSNTSALFTTIGDPNTSASFSHSFNKNVDVDYTLSHPKLKILKEIIHKHFLDYSARNGTTRAIIFSQYRDSVQEIGNMLNSLRPMVKPMIFIGKANTGTLGAGLKQKDQIKIVEQFRNGEFNVLVATSVGEEGLDIGEVDLIVCFDASRSPTRLIQRMGRTGRQRDGNTIFLLTSGKEERSYATSINQHSSISKTITDPMQLEPFLYKKSPRMVPLGIELSCYKMEINLPSEQPNEARVLGIENESETEGSEVKTKRKPAAVKPKKKTTAEKETPSGRGDIVKMFERIKAEPPAKKIKSDEQLPQEIEIIREEYVPDPPSPPRNDDVYFVEDDTHMFAVERHDVFNKSSVINKIFDLDSKDGHEWAPCTSFYKKTMPSSKAVSEQLTSSQLNNLVLDLEDLAELEQSVKNRSSFSFVNKDFCECGNTLEADSEVDRSKNSEFEISHGSRGNNSTNSSSTSFSDSMSRHSILNSNSTTDFSEPVLQSPFYRSSSKANLEPNFSHTSNIKNALPKSVVPSFPQKSTMRTNPDTFVQSSRLFSSSSTDCSEPVAKNSPINSGSSTDFSGPVVKSVYLTSSSSTDFSEPLVPQNPRTSANFNAPVSNYPSTLKPDGSTASQSRFTFKRKQPDVNQVKVDQTPSTSASHTSTYRQNVERISPNQIYNGRSQARVTTAPTSTSIPKLNQNLSSNPPPSNTKVDKLPSRNSSMATTSKQSQYLSSQRASAFKKTSPPRPCNPVKGTSPRPIFGRDPTSTEPYVSLIPYHNSSLAVTPEKDNLTDEDSVIEFSASPEANLITNPFIKDFQRMKTEASLMKSKEPTPVPEPDPVIRSKKIVTPVKWDNRNESEYVEDGIYVEDLEDVEDHVVDVEEEHDDSFDFDFGEDDFEARGEVVVGREKATDLSCSAWKAHSEKPLSPKRHGIAAAAESSSEGFDKSRSNFKFKKPPSTPFIEIETPPAVDPDTSESHDDQEEVDEIAEYYENAFDDSFEVTGRTVRKAVQSTRCESVTPLSPLSGGSKTNEAIYRYPIQRTRVPLRKHRSNPFIESQAVVSDQEGGNASDSNYDGEDGDDMDDSFVDHDDDDGITETQQAMYLKSTRDAIPTRFGRIETPLSPKYYGTTMDTSEEGYADDSFCQDDDEVEYSNVGVFTQAMNQAKIEIASGSSSGNRYQTRRAKKVEAASKGKSTSQTKQRRRIIAMDTSSDEN